MGQDRLILHCLYTMFVAGGGTRYQSMVCTEHICHLRADQRNIHRDVIARLHHCPERSTNLILFPRDPCLFFQNVRALKDLFHFNDNPVINADYQIPFSVFSPAYRRHVGVAGQVPYDHQQQAASRLPAAHWQHSSC